MEELDYEEFLTYLAYNSIEPFAEFREDERTALLAMLLHNSNIKDKKDALTMNDFMLRSSTKYQTSKITTDNKNQTSRMTTEEMLNKARKLYR